MTGLSDFNLATGLTLSSADVKYWTEYNDTTQTPTTNANSGAAVSNGAPVNAGAYYATLTVDTNKTAVITYTIAKADPVVTAPTANALTYTGSEQELVTAGSTSHGTLKYALASDGTYATTIPKATDAGNYSVYYKIEGDQNHKDKSYASPVSVTIGKATYAGTQTASGSILAGYASSNVEVDLPDIPDHMTYGTPGFATPITSASVDAANKKVKYSANNTVVESSTYTITVPVVEASGEKANYSDYNITVTLTGLECDHSSTTPVAEVAATCISDGVKAHNLCSVCGSKLVNGIVKTDEELKIDKLNHDIRYSASGAVIKAACSRKATCHKEDVTITLLAPSKDYVNSGYDGASLNDTAWAAESLAVPEIKYLGRGSTTYAESTTAPTNIGTYTAKITVASATAKVDFEIRRLSQSAPAENTGYVIDFRTETITAAGSDYEISTSNGESAVPVEGNKVKPGSTYYVRKKAYDVYAPSEWVAFTAPARNTVPNEFKSIVVDNSGSDGAVIVGVNSTMEYSADRGSTWTQVAGNEITGLMPGVILIRTRATDDTFAGESLEVVIDSGEVVSKVENTAVPVDNSVMEEIANKVPVTAEEQAKIDSGKKLNINLEITDNTAITEESKKAIDAALTKELGNNAKVGKYLDISIFKFFEGENKEDGRVTDLGENEIEFSITVPDDIYASDRDYRILRNHDGKVDLLGSYNPSTRKITFGSALFSDYAIVYIEKESFDYNYTANSIKLSSKLRLTAANNATIEWAALDGADSYEIYMGYCGSEKAKLVKTVTAGKTTKVTIKKLDGKAINQSRNIKAYVLAVKTIDGKKTTIGKTIVVHSAGKKVSRYTNAKKVTVKNSTVSLKKGKTSTIKASTVKENSKKSLLAHNSEFRYVSTNTKIATVNAQGKISAKAKGTCYVYVYALNGCSKRVKVTVVKN